ncbi:MAG: hypothetical protein ACYTJ0_07660, partial [Planctomycetota bacterium]
LEAACPKPGACCLPDGTCQDIPAPDAQATCEEMDGVFRGEGSTCETLEAACPKPGACCLPDGTCQDIPAPGAQFKCEENFGGVFRGEGGTCATLEEQCPQPGACCLKDGSCVEVEAPSQAGMRTAEQRCLDMGGEFLGDGTSCDPNLCPRDHPGWNWVDNLIVLTKNEPAYWSAATGEPKGVSPFTVLDPGGPGLLPGRPDPEDPDDRVLRGYIIAYAVGTSGAEIRWNHLKGDATIVNYEDTSAWEYNAISFPVVDGMVANGAELGTPGELRLDGAEYATPFDLLLMDFYATGSCALGALIDTDLTLLPASVDLRQETDGPVTTKAHFDVWNMEEIKFSGAYRCITCWDQWLLSRHGTPNHFLRATLQTDKGKARIDGLASALCDVDNDPKDQKALGQGVNDVVSRNAALLGVVARVLTFGQCANVVGIPDEPPVARSGTNLHGMGQESALIQVDTLGPPPEASGPEGALVDPVDELLRLAGLSGLAPTSPRGPAEQGGVSGVAGPSRNSATEKGSLLIFPKVELKWKADGSLVQDTFIDISNDYPEDVMVQMFFIQGDPPIDKHEPVKDAPPVVD